MKVFSLSAQSPMQRIDRPFAETRATGSARSGALLGPNRPRLFGDMIIDWLETVDKQKGF